tara:strand:+ start:559 stop:957 length:399 start_codon:yes stop_codon:yes gene_type:complete
MKKILLAILFTIISTTANAFETELWCEGSSETYKKYKADGTVKIIFDSYETYNVAEAMIWSDNLPATISLENMSLHKERDYYMLFPGVNDFKTTIISHIIVDRKHPLITVKFKKELNKPSIMASCKRQINLY